MTDEANRLGGNAVYIRGYMTEVVCILDARAELGEGILWDPETQAPPPPFRG